MKASRASGDEDLEKWITLVEWMTSNGGYLHESVQIAKDDQRGVHFNVKKDWKDGVAKDTHIIKIPVAATMSYLNLVEHPLPADKQGNGAATFSAHGVQLPREFVDAVGPHEYYLLLDRPVSEGLRRVLVPVYSDASSAALLDYAIVL